ncbi:MAG: aminopeptidase P family protein [Treponema sp.]|jgi:Xaa-Pro dipeptidase|nr:aminopeptidase P family protein [Treponema sp.]
MKEFTDSSIKHIYKERIKTLADYMVENQIGAAVFINNEEHRDPSVSYFTGLQNDGILIIYSDTFSILLPWDEILAKKTAFYDKLIPFTRFKCNTIEAIKSTLNLTSDDHNLSQKIDMPPYLSYSTYLHYLDDISSFQLRCTENGCHAFVEEMRMKKDCIEAYYTRKACEIGDLIIDEIEKQIRNGEIKTEMDVALLIERECRKNGCEKTGFETLVANPTRSFAIHATPNYTDGKFPMDGLSIIDFGVVYNGYTSDTTITIAKGELTEAQKMQLSLVQKAYDECLPLYTKENLIKDAALKADSVFAKAKMKMPHTLGHAIGLEIHEKPRVSSKTQADLHFQPGMILTLEPGLYDAKNGGCRLENDVLITDEGNEVLSHSRIIYI